MPRLIEIDHMTGNERDITWTVNWNSDEPTKEDVERAIKRNTGIVVGRYGYRMADWDEVVDG